MNRRRFLRSLAFAAAAPCAADGAQETVELVRPDLRA